MLTNALFLEHPVTDAMDGHYRLYGEVDITADSKCGRMKWFRVNTNTEAGKEVPGTDIGGSVNIRTTFWFTKADGSQGEVRWLTWGKPNILLNRAFRLWHRARRLTSGTWVR